jgi:hypothetical protein
MGRGRKVVFIFSTTTSIMTIHQKMPLPPPGQTIR